MTDTAPLTAVILLLQWPPYNIYGKRYTEQLTIYYFVVYNNNYVIVNTQ